MTTGIAGLKKLLEEATPGPWRVEEDGAETEAGWIWPHGAWSENRADLEAIVALVNAAPALLDVVEWAQDEHSLVHPAGDRFMADGSWQPCPICASLSSLDEVLKP